MLQDIFEIISKHREGFAQGILVTFKLCLIIWGSGLAVGAIVGYMSNRIRLVQRFVKVLSFVLSGVPILVFLFWLHYPAQSFLGINVDPFITAAFMISLLNTISVSDIVYQGINRIPGQYLEAAKVCGIPSRKIFFSIQFPLMMRQVLPSLLITQTNMLHLTLFSSLISVEETFRVAQRVISIEYKPVEIYTALGIFFLLISLPINGLAAFLKYKYRRRLDEK